MKMINLTARYKKWLENEVKKEGMIIKVLFIKNDYTAWANPNLLWSFKISRSIGTIKIPEDFFISEKPKFTEKERRAIGLHELGHLKMVKIFGRWGVYRRQRKRKTWSESKADDYAKKRGFGKSLASGLKKGRELKEKWRGESWRWRRKIWWRELKPFLSRFRQED